MSVARQFLIYGIGGAASRLAAIILVPLYTRALNIGEYGHLEVLLGLHALALLLMGLQSESAVARDYFEAREQGTLAQLKWAGLVITAMGSGLLVGCWALAAAIGYLPREIAGYAPLIFAMTVPAQIFAVQLIILRFAGNPAGFAFLSFLDLTLCAVFSAVLILRVNLGVSGALIGIMLSKVLCMFLAWPRSFGRLRGHHPSRALVRRMLAYALPTMPSVLLNWLQTNGTRVLLAAFLMLSDVAIAGLAIKVAALYGFLVYSFRLAWEPYSFEKLATLENDPQVYARALQWYVLAMFPIAGMTVIVSPLLVSILAPAAYAAATSLTTFFILGQFWTGAISVLAIGIHGARKTSRLTHVYGWGAVLNVALLAGLSGIVGVSAAAIGFFASSMLSALLAAWYSNRYFDTRFSARLLALSFVATTLFGIAGYMLHKDFAYPGAALGEQLRAAGGIAVALLASSAIIGIWGTEAGRLRQMADTLVRAILPKVRRR